MCLSGDLIDLDESQWALVERAMAFYQRVAPIIKHGESHRLGPVIKSYRHPTGWQAMIRFSEAGLEALLVVHVFANPETEEIVLPLPSSAEWQILESFTGSAISMELQNNQIRLRFGNSYYAAVLRPEGAAR